MSYMTEEPEWLSFYPTFSSSMYIEKAGYFDERPVVNTGVTQILTMIALPFLLFQSMWFILLLPFILFGFGTLFIKLPVHTGIQDCDSAGWGLHYHSNTFWLYVGGAGNFEGGMKMKTWHVPVITKQWHRTSILLKDGTWEHEMKGNRKDFFNKEWKDKQAVWHYEFTDMFDGTKVPTTIYVEEREWRRKGLRWLEACAVVRRTIDVHFSKEVGKGKGNWKGGTVGCGYNMLPGEDPLDCLKRMEKDRNF